MWAAGVRVASHVRLTLAFAENLCSNKSSGSKIIDHCYREDVDNIYTSYFEC